MKSVCGACQVVREVAELLGFWPRGEPWRVSYVCRPGIFDGFCFRRLVGPSYAVAIALADRLPDGVGASQGVVRAGDVVRVTSVGIGRQDAFLAGRSEAPGP